jgi:predicted  nucleic acid-binding Zn-ribbon protein
LTTALLIFLILAAAVAVARFLMRGNLGAVRAEIAEQELEQRRVKARWRAIEDEFQRLEQAGRELDTEVSGMRERMAEIREQVKTVKEISRRRIEAQAAARD